ncbi:unnamed protein product, partial [Ectocarpus sp. 4 AP-2014]
TRTRNVDVPPFGLHGGYFRSLDNGVTPSASNRGNFKDSVTTTDSPRSMIRKIPPYPSACPRVSTCWAPYVHVVFRQHCWSVLLGLGVDLPTSLIPLSFSLRMVMTSLSQLR